MKKPNIRTPLFVAIFAMAVAGCGGNNNVAAGQSEPAAPKGLGYADTAPVQDPTTVLPYVDYAYTNQRGYAQYANLATNAGVRVVSGFLNLWTPSSLLVDAGVTAPAAGGFPAITPSTWTGIPGDSTDGTKANTAVLNANIQFAINETVNRTPEQAVAAYLDDRRNKGYSVTDGLGPLTAAWQAAAQQTTTITNVAPDATTVLYNDTGNNLGVGSTGGNTSFGSVVDFINYLGTNASTEPAKRFFKYARPWRWSSSVVVVPALVPAESTTPSTDGGYISGHEAEAMRDAIGMAYAMPERYQEILSRALELGENRILAGMHSPLDVIAGRIQAEAAGAANLYAQSIQTTAVPGSGNSTVTDLRNTAYTQAHSALMAAAGTTNQVSFNNFAHSGTLETDRFADWATNQANFLRRLTFGFSQIASTTQPANVPKGAEILLETRQPYLTAAQRRVVLKSTALPSGYPVMDDAEGWGRLNLFAAADGYGNFNGDVSVTMTASLGGFNALDNWKNNISGTGMLTMNGTGTLRLTGNNSYSGGTTVNGGVLEADSGTAFGSGDLYVAAGTAACNAPGPVTISGNYTQLSAGSLQVTLSSGGQTALFVGAAANIAGTLNVNFANGYTPAVGTVLTIISSAGNLQGTFGTVTVNGHQATTSYSSRGMQITITS